MDRRNNGYLIYGWPVDEERLVAFLNKHSSEPLPEDFEEEGWLDDWFEDKRDETKVSDDIDIVKVRVRPSTTNEGTRYYVHLNAASSGYATCALDIPQAIVDEAIGLVKQICHPEDFPDGIIPPPRFIADSRGE